MTKLGKSTILIIIVIIVAVGVYWWQRGDALLVQPTSDQQDIIGNRATNALKAVESVANELTGLRTDNPLGFEIVDIDTKSGNFGISQSDRVRSEDIVKEHMVIFQEVASWENNILTNNTAEVDLITNKVVAMHRTPTRNYGGAKSAEKVEELARQFLTKVYPEFTQIESTLEFDLGSKSGSEETSYFFRWNDKRFALPAGLEMDLPPFVQVGITASGFIFSYDNTIQLYSNLSKEALRAICAFVEMPRSDDSSLDQEKGEVIIWFSEYEPFQNRYLVLPYEPETDFEGCSESAKMYLRHLPNDP